MSIVLIGVSHKTAPVEVRERLAFNEQRLHDALRQVVDQQTISEGLIVSTCNRVEILAATPAESESGVAHLYDFIYRYHGAARESLNGHFYHYADLAAIRHLQTNMSRDGKIPDGTADAVLKFVATTNENVRKANIDLSDLYTNEFTGGN